MKTLALKSIRWHLKRPGKVTPEHLNFSKQEDKTITIMGKDLLVHEKEQERGNNMATDLKTQTLAHTGRHEWDKGQVVRVGMEVTREQGNDRGNWNCKSRNSSCGQVQTVPIVQQSMSLESKGKGPDEGGVQVGNDVPSQ